MANKAVDALSPGTTTDAEALRDAYRELRDDGENVRCNTCNADPMTPDRIVAGYPTPWREVVERALLCHECWALEAADETVLGEEQAQVLAAQAVGFDQHEMASAVGGYEDEVDDHLQELSQLRREVEDEMDDLMRTAQLFDSI